MFVLKSTAREYERRAIAAEKAAAEASADRRKVGRALSEKIAECNALAAELAPLKAGKERSLQNLRNANAARSAKAREGLGNAVEAR